MKHTVRVEAPITNYLRDFVLDLEKYQVVQFFLMQEDRKQEDCNFFWYCTCMASSAEYKSFCEVPKYVINTRPHCPKLMKFMDEFP